jgi:hypothetical protein
MSMKKPRKNGLIVLALSHHRRSESIFFILDPIIYFFQAPVLSDAIKKRAERFGDVSQVAKTNTMNV